MMDYWQLLISPLHSFTEFSQRIFWIYLWSSLIIAVISYAYYRNTGVITKKGLFNYLFPRNVYFHRSAINDYLFFYANFIFQAAFILPLFGSVIVVISSYINDFFIVHFSNYQGYLDVSSTSKGLLVTFFIVLVADFCLFFVHYFQHKIPWLWEFHKVHHSAEVLTPISVFRMHPVDNMFAFAFKSLMVGFVLGIFNYLSASELVYFHINGVNIFFIAFYLCAYNLRHSHIWVSYGQIMSHVFISPAQHQIHHSSAPKHFDKNMGFMFSFWDKLFNTLYIPENRENIVFGLGHQENTKYTTFWSLYLMPFINLFKNFEINLLFQPKRIFSALLFFIIVIPAILINSQEDTVKSLNPSVYLQDLTWKEVDQALNNGVTTVIIPTGGTEQNGPHVILGKHNYIVKYTAGRVAEDLGNTLVAPVIAYVPEGPVTPPEGHMKFAGTLSISNAEFRNLLESSARSLKQHGFKVIAFIGDSGGNQEDQAFVAGKLSALWESDNIKAIHIGDYYQNNKQVNFLKNNGYSISEIGSHAGIRDTSELMAISSDGVRDNLRMDYSSSDYNSVGSNGDSSKASVFLGNKLLDLKIAAAVNQMKQFVAVSSAKE